MTTHLTLIQGVQKWVGQNQVLNIHITEYSMFLKPELDQLGFAQKWAKCLKRMRLIQDSTVIQ